MRAANTAGRRRSTAGDARVINFRDVAACGTNTETLAALHVRAGRRRDYDERRIRTGESLLHLLKRAGFQVLWRDNQSGCNGVCDGLAAQQRDNAELLESCDGGRCLDQVLLQRATRATACSPPFGTRRPSARNWGLVCH